MSWVDRFWSYVDKQGEADCWDWTGAKTTSGGYGVLTMSKGDVRRAHRLSYIIAYGDFDSRLFVRHKCDNPLCVNPKHLELGTHQDNMSDMAERGRRKRTHCKKGHELNEDNAYTNKRGHRYCKVCKRDKARESYKAMRGDKFGKAEYKVRTHCKHGHEFTDQNTYTRPDGYKECIICRNSRSKRFRQNEI